MNAFRRPLSSGIDLISLAAAEASGLPTFEALPFSLRILAEGALRQGDTEAATAIARRDTAATIRMRPARILMQDSSGLTVLADLAALRDASARGAALEPSIPVDLVVDHSVEVDAHGRPDAADINLALELRRNAERYRFLRWAEGAFRQLRIVPPGAGICHQVNLEILAGLVTLRDGLAIPDTMLGTDSHSTMVNALGVLGWGVGGIEALAAMLGRPTALRVPRVLGVRLHGRLGPGVTATDLALTLTERLRQHGVVGKIVEFDGPGLAALALADRASIANMAPEYGATMGFFPIDEETLRYLRLTGRETRHVALIEAYARAQGLWGPAASRCFDETLDFDLGDVEPSVAGPSRPNQRLALGAVPASLPAAALAPGGGQAVIGGGDIAIAAITSCTNTANPSVMLRAGLLARAARRRGLKARPWVKASISPGSRVVTDYLRNLGLLDDLAACGFALAGHGCMTCMGNSGPLDPSVEAAIREGDLHVAAVLSGNRNFEGRVHPLCRLGYLASPPLVLAYALVGHVRDDLATTALGHDAEGRPVMLSELWPTDEAVEEAMRALDPGLFIRRGQDAFEGPPGWRGIDAPTGPRFPWDPASQFLRPPPFASGPAARPQLGGDLHGARVLALLGDDVTTDHISPISRIPARSDAGEWLLRRGTDAGNLQSYSARRANHDVMARGTFANLRLRNRLVPELEGGFTRHLTSGEVMTIHAAAEAYAAEGVPLLILAGRNYGAGSARDWAAKGSRLLGIRAVVAAGFERIHRANLIAMGVLPLLFPDGRGALELGLTGEESFSLQGVAEALRPGGTLTAVIAGPGGTRTLRLTCAIATREEAEDLANGGVMAGLLAAHPGESPPRQG